MLVTQSCLTLCDPMDCSLPGSSVHGIPQAILEWVAITVQRASAPFPAHGKMVPSGGQWQWSHLSLQNSIWVFCFFPDLFNWFRIPPWLGLLSECLYLPWYEEYRKFLITWTAGLPIPFYQASVIILCGYLNLQNNPLKAPTNIYYFTSEIHVVRHNNIWGINLL